MQETKEEKGIPEYKAVRQWFSDRMLCSVVFPQVKLNYILGCNKVQE
jgi:hypothetical protein